MISRFVRIGLVAMCMLAIVLPMRAQAEAKYLIKLGILAPEGSTWINVVHQMDKEIQAKTNGEVAFKLYPGGVSGDEPDMIRKMRIGQLHAAGLTGIGMGQIVPSVRVIELPLLFKNYGEVDAALAAVGLELAKSFDAQGFVHLGWAEAGFANLLTQKPVTKRSDLDGLKMWAWAGDKLVAEAYSILGVTPVDLALTDVMVSLQTGMISGVYASPLAAVALQWFTKTKYLTENPLAYSVAGLLVSKKFFDTLPPQHQQTVKAVVAAKAKELVALTRKENDEALLSLKQNGVQIVKLTPDAETEFATLSKKIQQNLVGKLYSQALLDKVTQAIATVRK